MTGSAQTVPGEAPVSWQVVNPVIMPVLPEVSRLTGKEKIAALSHAARGALHHSERLSSATLQRLEKNERGAPLPEAGVHWSLSHTSSYVAAVTAPYPVGIDIEKIIIRSPLIYDKVADPEEWRLAPERSDWVLYRYWTAKEAVLKAVGRGLSGLSQCRVEEIVDEYRLKLNLDSITWLVTQNTGIDNHIASITHGRLPVVWHVHNP